MKFSVPNNAMIVVADGNHATYYRNVGTSEIKIEKVGDLSPNSQDGKDSARVPNETSPNEMNEAKFAKQLADDLSKHLDDNKITSLVLIADPQTLGQIRPSLHKEITKRITGELHKTLTKSSIAEIEKVLTNALS